MSELISRDNVWKLLDFENPLGFNNDDIANAFRDAPTITDEEFKAEAKRRGYNLIKKPEPVKLLPCVCGRKRIGSFYRQGNMHYYKCETCGLSAAPGTSERHAKVN